jgi:hypothetical protein
MVHGDVKQKNEEDESSGEKREKREHKGASLNSFLQG